MNDIFRDNYLIDFLNKNKIDKKTFITFLFFDIKTIKNKDLQNNIQNSINHVIEEKSNVFMNVLTKKKESHKKKIYATLKKYEANIKLIDKQLFKVKSILDNIQLSRKLKNNKFENKQNFKIEKNVFFIHDNNNLKYIYGELFARYLIFKINKK